MTFEFKNISGKNIFSIGKAVKNIDFINGITVIKGKNGNGKSTIFEMLYFILTGKSYRGIKKNSIINHTNKKDLEVQLNLKKNNKNITIIRRLKPKKDTPQDVLIIDNKETNFIDKKNFQMEIEKILGINEQILKQQIFLSQNFYEPFVELSPESKRKFISRIFDLDKFKEMELKLKEDIKKLKYDIDILNVNITNLEDKIKYVIENEIERKKVITVRINSCKDIIQETNDKILKNLENLYVINQEKINKENDINKLKNEIESLNKKIYTNNQILNQKNNLNEKINTLTDELNIIQNDKNKIYDENEKLIKMYKTNKIKEKNKKINEQIILLNENIKTTKNKINEDFEMIKFYDENDKCPTCNKELTDKERDKERDKLVNNIEKNKKELMKLEEKRKLINEKSIKLLTLKTNIEKIIDNIEQNYDNEINRLKYSINNYKEQLDNIVDIDIDEIEKIKKEIKDKVKILDNIESTINVELDKQKHNDKIESENKNLNYKVKTNEGLIKDYESELNKLKNSDIKQFEEELKEKNTDQKRNKLKLTYLERLYNMVKKDDGIKKYIVQQYLPTLNQYVNQYAKSFNFHNKIVIDNGGMNISIFHRGKEKEIGSYSSGELQKINMSILFAFQSLLRIKSGIDFPLLLLDEITAPLDTDNAELFYKILKEDFSDMYIMIINHRIEETDSEYVNRVIEVSKNSNGFSDYKILN